MIAKVTALALISSAALASAPAPLAFDMKDPKGVSGLTLSIDSALEPLMGSSGSVSGKILFDPASPEKTTGKIVVNASAIRMNNDTMTEHMQRDTCLDVAKYPTVEFVVTKVENVVKGDGNSWNANVTGDFTLHGVTKSVTAKASATHVVDGLQQRGGMPGKKGDLLIIRSNFSINRLDFGIAESTPTAIVGNKVDIQLATTGVVVKS